ncbi:MAG: response regulator transcription factor [Candidatus Nanopelagicales bacterium]|nr:response regulator transcription factor [Candidatus Nanopelagicales bacterium]MCF8539933.1 response regulator transcription factor [Candidatus Nanopelagicales bacterium]MCF8551148.1 response regulator transcription factor [Candidatus Nanopelagicales bacterium]
MDHPTVDAPIRVLVLDDDSFTRVTVAGALVSEGFEVAGSVDSVTEAIQVGHSTRLNAAVLDLDLGPGPNGIDVAFGLRKLQPEIGIVILTSFSDPRLLASSVKEPPQGSSFVVKQSLVDIRILSEAVRGSLVQSNPLVTQEPVPLTNSQIETLRLLSYGLSNAEIARVRVVSEKSVEQSIARSAKRLDIKVHGTMNQRVALAREYFRLTGAVRHRHAHR